MANPSVASMLLRLRGLLNEPEAAFVSDDGNEGIVWISDGVVNFYDAVVSQLQEDGRDKSVQHPFLRHFVTALSGVTVADTDEYDFPETMDYPLWLWYGSPLRPAVESTMDAFDLDRDGDLYGPSVTRAIWTPQGSQFRLFVMPGDAGSPTEAIAWKLWYIARPQPLTTVGALLPIPQNWTSGPLYWAAAQWAAKERKAVDSWMQLFQMAATNTAKRR